MLKKLYKIHMKKNLKTWLIQSKQNEQDYYDLNFSKRANENDRFI